MPWIHRNASNEIVKLTRWQNGSTAFLPDDHPDVVACLNPPPPPDADAELAAAISVATTLDELKAALLGNAGRAGRAAGRLP